MTKQRQIGGTKDVVSRSVEDAGGPKMAAAILGLSPARIYCYMDEADPAQITYDQMRRLLLATRAPRALPDDVAAICGAEFSPVDPSTAPLDELLKHSAKEYGEFIVAAMQAVQTPTERAQMQKLLAEGRELQAVATQIVHHLARRLADV